MLANAKVAAVIPVTNLNRARQFYEGLLGLTPARTSDDIRGSVFYDCNGTSLTVYQRETASSGDHTIAGFEVEPDAFDAVIDRLIENGITLDTFEIPGSESNWDERGVLSDGSRASAWFKDPDGNVLAIASNVF